MTACSVLTDPDLVVALSDLGAYSLCLRSPSPVQVVNGNAQSSAVDWWTLGILVYEVCHFSAAPVVLVLDGIRL